MLSVECPGAVVQLKNSGTLLCCDVPWYTVRCTYRDYLNEGAELAHEGRQVPPLDQGCTELTAREHSEHHFIKYTHVPICILYKEKNRHTLQYFDFWQILYGPKRLEVFKKTWSLLAISKPGNCFYKFLRWLHSKI